MAVRQYKDNRQRRHRRVRAKVAGTSACPRLSVFRSNKHIYAQLIDDRAGVSLSAATDLGDDSFAKSSSPAILELTAQAKVARGVGYTLAQKAVKEGIKKVVFDRGGYKYHGRVKALADGAREGGLVF